MSTEEYKRLFEKTNEIEEYKKTLFPKKADIV